MIIIVGLVILVAALVVAAVGVLGNGGSAHPLTHFSVLGYHVTGSAGMLFLAGIVVGAAGMLGLSLLLAGARRRRRRGSAATRRLRQSRRETAAVSQERDDLIEERDTARASTASKQGNGIAAQSPQVNGGSDRWSRIRGLRHRPDPALTGQADTLPRQPLPELPASAPDVGVTAISPASDVPAVASDPDVAATSPVLDTHVTASSPAE